MGGDTFPGIRPRAISATTFPKSSDQLAREPRGAFRCDTCRGCRTCNGATSGHDDDDRCAASSDQPPTQRASQVVASLRGAPNDEQIGVAGAGNP
jgi:hypothetical protein